MNTNWLPVTPSELGLAPIRLQWDAGVAIGGIEALRTLDEFEIEFPGKNVYSWNLFESN